MAIDLATLGWSEKFAQSFKELARPGNIPGRVIDERRGAFRVLTATGEVPAMTPGKLKHRTTRSTLPTVGDWVVLRKLQGEKKCVIDKVLPRSSKLSRRAAGLKEYEQVLAANIDFLFLVAGLDSDFNIRRIERGMAMAWESGATPVLLLNKADLCSDLPEKVALAEAAAPGVPVHTISAVDEDGLLPLLKYLQPARTIAIIGSSGVGKSTILNQLIGRTVMNTNVVRAHDDKGQHTTSHRELFILEGGALLIDTPGLREIQLWEVEKGIAEAFDDVSALASGCKFRDCKHDTEPGCAVREAIPAARLASYLKLKGEQQHLERKADPAKAAKAKRDARAANKLLRNKEQEKK